MIRALLRHFDVIILYQRASVVSLGFFVLSWLMVGEALARQQSSPQTQAQSLVLDKGARPESFDVVLNVQKNESPNPGEIPATESVVNKIDETQFNPSYVLTQLGAIRQEISKMREQYAGKVADKNFGYDGSFFLQSDDENFRLNFNFRSQVRYGFNIAEDVQDGHSLHLRRQFVILTGNAYGEKATFTLIMSPSNSPAFINVDIGYQFNDAFALHATEDSLLFTAEVAESSGKLSFIENSIMSERYDIGPSFGLYATGSYKKFSYYLGVFNSLDTDLAPNANTEMAYSLRLDFSLLDSLSDGMSDLDFSEKPALHLGMAGIFGHYDSGTQGRMMAVTSDLRFKYRGFTMSLAGVYRQTDLDQFTRAQTDLAATAYASYFLVPKKFELAVRYSQLFDDVTDAGVNINMAAGNRTKLESSLSGGDVDGDSDNEWETSVGLNYYVSKYNVKVQGQYLMVVDGIPGPDDLVNHIGMAQVQLQF